MTHIKRRAISLTEFGKMSSLLVLSGISSGCASKQDEKPLRPNVLLIVADDLGLGDVSCYGSRTISTPHIDSLSSAGLRFQNCYATSATSTPSRFALFTGMYPWRNSDAKILPGDAPLLIDPSLPTLPKMMQEEGYSTAAIGKWHLGMGYGKLDWNKEITPSGNTVGFDYTNLIPATVDRVPTVYVENGKVVGLEKDDPILVDYEKNFDGEPTALTNPELMRMKWLHGHQGTVINGIPRIGYMKGGKAARWDDTTMADYFLSKVTDFIEEHKSEPFFLYYGLHEPHVPRVPGERFAGASGLGCRGDAVIEADWCVGQVIAKLRALGLLENTLIIVTSDNGAVLQDGYDDGAEEIAIEKGHDPDNGLRGGKYSLYDAGTHIPFIVYWKGHIEPAVSRAYFCQMDLYATLGELTGGKVPEGLDSESYPDVLLGRRLEGGRESQVIEAQGRLAYRKGNHVLIPSYSGANTNSTGIELGCNSEDTLWDLEKDPSQGTPTDNTELLRTLKNEFLQQTGKLYSADTAVDPLE